MGSRRTAETSLFLTAQVIAARKLTPADTLILKYLFPSGPDKIAVAPEVRAPLGEMLASPRTRDGGVWDVGVQLKSKSKGP